VRQQWENDRFVQPSAIDQRTLNHLDSHLLAAASQFEALELSPVAPLGACSSVALTSQNRIVSTARGTEVVSDPTNVLALECARRLRAAPDAVVKLATSHRCVRAQPVPKRPGFAQHFRMFCLASAGHEQKDHAFLTGALLEHIRTRESGADHHQHFEIGALQAWLNQTTDAKRSLRHAAKLYDQDHRSWTMDYKRQVETLLAAIDAGTHHELQLRWIDHCINTLRLQKVRRP